VWEVNSWATWADHSRVRYATVLQAGEQYRWGRLLRAFVWRNCWEHFGFAQEMLSASTQAMKSMATESIEARTQVNSRQINDSRAAPSKTRSRDLTSPRRSAVARAFAALLLAHLAARRSAAAREKSSFWRSVAPGVLGLPAAGQAPARCWCTSRQLCKHPEHALARSLQELPVVWLGWRAAERRAEVAVVPRRTRGRTASN
jgi:hypothetical protein